MQRNAVQDVFGLKDPRGTNAKYEHAIVHRDFDLELYEDVKTLSPAMENTLIDGNNKLKTFSNLSEDIFMNLFKFNPEMRDSKDMLPSRTFNYDLLSELAASPDFEKLRDMCKLNMLNSAIGTEVIHNEAITRIEQVIYEYQQKLQEAKNNNLPADKLPQDIIDQINKLAEQENQNGTPADQDGGDPFSLSLGGSGGQLLDENTSQQLANAMSQLQQDQAMQQMQKDIADAMKQATRAAADDVQEMSEFLESWGLEGGEGQRVSIESVKQALERIRNSEELKKLTKILGRFRSIAKNNLKKKSKGEAGSIKNVTTGRVLVKMLPTERGLLASERTKPLFHKKYNEKQLLQYEIENNKRKGLGPVVVCLDISGSMGGKKLEWGKAVALALLEVALKQKRNYSLLMFDTTIAYEWEILKGEADPNTIIDIASVGTQGGTDFAVPTYRAMKIINKSPNFRKADITFITDGDCAMSPHQEKEFIDMKIKKNVKVQTIVINSGGHCSMKGVENWSDKVTTVSKLADLNENLASEIFNLSIDEGDPADVQQP